MGLQNVRKGQFKKLSNMVPNRLQNDRFPAILSQASKTSSGAALPIYHQKLQVPSIVLTTCKTLVKTGMDNLKTLSSLVMGKNKNSLISFIDFELHRELSVSC